MPKKPDNTDKLKQCSIIIVTRTQGNKRDNDIIDSFIKKKPQIKIPLHRSQHWHNPKK